jgi:hypothetical protein
MAAEACLHHPSMAGTAASAAFLQRSRAQVLVILAYLALFSGLRSTSIQSVNGAHQQLMQGLSACVRSSTYSICKAMHAYDLALHSKVQTV